VTLPTGGERRVTLRIDAAGVRLLAAARRARLLTRVTFDGSGGALTLRRWPATS
jgi:hypothetical protein